MIAHTNRSWIACAALLALANWAYGAAFSAGNIVVVRSGDDNYVSADGAAAPAYLDEYTRDGALVQSIPMGNYTDTVNPQFTLNGGNNNGGFISKSYNGQYFTLGGYNAPLATAAVASTTSSTNARLIARVDMNGNVNQTTALGDVGSNEIRAVTSFDGSQFWLTGTGSAQTTRYTTLGSTTSVRVATSSSGFGPRAINIFKDAAGDPQLYVSRSSSSGPLNTLILSGNKLPTSSTAAATSVYTTSASSGYDFLFLTDSLLYVTDDDNTSVGGIQRWSRSGSTWTRDYVLQTNLSAVPLRGLTGWINPNGVPVLFATSGNGQNLVSVVDQGATSPFATIVNLDALGNRRFHDVVLVPEPATAGLLALGGLMLMARRRKA